MSTITGLAEIAGLCQAPFGEVKPTLFRGAVRDPARFFGEAHIRQMIASDTLRRRAGIFRDQQLVSLADHPGDYTAAGMQRARGTGISLTLRGVQRAAGPVRGACVAIATTGWPTVHAVALESPVSVQALATHWDCNPVVAVQTAGRKRWTVYPPIESVTTASAVIEMWKTRSSGRDYTPAEQARMAAEGPADEVVLEPGDAYFVPAGWPHAPMAVLGTSLHVSICPLPQAVVDEFGNEDHFLDPGPL